MKPAFVVLISLVALRVYAAEDNSVSKLTKLARDPKYSVSQRGAAIQMLGQLGAKGLGTNVKDAVECLEKVLNNDPQVEDFEGGAFLKLQAAQAIENIGPAAKDSLADLSGAVSYDRFLNHAIYSAAYVVTQVADTSAAPKAADGSTASLINNLSDPSIDAAERLLIIKKVEDIGKVPADALGAIAKLITSDPDPEVRQEAANATKYIIVNATTNVTKNDSDLRSMYVDNLKTLLKPPAAGDTGKTDERVFAAASLATVATQDKFTNSRDAARGALYNFTKDSNPLVQAIATAATASPK
jgi:hypothetical protein